MLKSAPVWVKDMSWENLDLFFVNIFQETNEKHLLKYGAGATRTALYDYLNARWVDREKQAPILEALS
ncbi:MAG TPA: hypothetical protein VJ742_09510 [Nitrososphaera sp.]|nr:hypothetical protein [Nitrososphaera sp.]